MALAEVIGASLDLTETLRATAKALQAVTGANRALIYLHDPGRDTLRQVITTSDQINWDELVTLRGRPIGEIPLWFAVRDSPSGVLELPDSVGLRALSPERAKAIGMAGTLGLALRHASVERADGTPLGLAFCTWDEPQPAFEPRIVHAAKSIAAQAAVAIANAHNHARGEDLAKRLTALASWAARLAAAGSPEQVRARTTRAAGLLLDSPLVAHWSPDIVTWYPAPPVVGTDHEAALGALAQHDDRFQAIARESLPAELAAGFAARGLTHAAVSIATNRRSMLLVGRTSGVSGIDAQVASLLTDLADSALRTAEAHQKVAHLALTDPLTEVGNRRAFEARLTEGLALTSRTGQPLSLCLVDLDNFRAFNEVGGHQMGDDALRIVADALRHEMRTSDLAFRIGGDEFALVLPDTVATSGAALLERVRIALATTHLGPLSITAGVAQAPADGGDLAALYAAADEALYAGKHAGRGRVCIATIDPAQTSSER
jgi:diguanylate cyclase (GGDEF)-like protein